MRKRRIVCYRCSCGNTWSEANAVCLPRPSACLPAAESAWASPASIIDPPPPWTICSQSEPSAEHSMPKQWCQRTADSMLKSGQQVVQDPEIHLLSLRCCVPPLQLVLMLPVCTITCFQTYKVDNPPSPLTAGCFASETQLNLAWAADAAQCLTPS